MLVVYKYQTVDNMKAARFFIYFLLANLFYNPDLVIGYVMPISGDCSKYQVCDFSGCFVFNCGIGTEFNPRILVCDYPLQDRGTCGTRGYPEQISVPSSVRPSAPLSLPNYTPNYPPNNPNIPPNDTPNYTPTNTPNYPPNYPPSYPPNNTPNYTPSNTPNHPPIYSANSISGCTTT